MKKLVIALALALTLAGCSGSDTGEDSGVAQCKKLAATAAEPVTETAVPTDEEFDEVSRAYADSEFSDLKRAGLAHLEEVKDYYDDGGADIQGVLVKRSLLDDTCAAHGVPIVRPEPR